ncbi:hypothetical protein M0804_007067 [Polistes exclamans]|nr:hypothetical protein M0804_007067 [Polistes exclamans]
MSCDVESPEEEQQWIPMNSSRCHVTAATAAPAAPVAPAAPGALHSVTSRGHSVIDQLEEVVNPLTSRSVTVRIKRKESKTKRHWLVNQYCDGDNIRVGSSSSGSGGDALG